MNPVVSITVVTLNKVGLAKLCLGSIIEYTNIPFDLTIVDNGSIDELKSLYDNFDVLKKQMMDANEYCCNINLVRFPENRYICAATNVGFENRQGQYFCFIPSDTIMTEGYITKLLDGMSKYKLDGISPRWFEERHRIDIMDPYNSATAWGEEFKHGKVFGYNKRDDCEFNWMVGIMYLIKRELWEKVGGWDEQFKLSVMDNDFCWRAMVHGFQLGIINDVWIFHAGPVTRMDEQQNPGYQKIGDQDWKKFEEKWGTNPDDISFLWQLQKEGVIRKKTSADAPDAGIPKEIKEKRITTPEYKFKSDY